MKKFFELLTTASKVILPGNGASVSVVAAAVTGCPDNQVVRLEWADTVHGTCGTVLTEDGLANAAYDAEAHLLRVEDSEGDNFELKLYFGEVASDSTGEFAYVVVQEGGSSSELYVHIRDTHADAVAHRIDCRDEGSYRTSEVIKVPDSLASHPDFLAIVSQLLKASQSVDYPSDEGDDDGDVK